MTQHPNPKAAVALIRDAFAQRNSAIKTKDAYNLLAQLWGYKDWAVASAMLTTPIEPQLNAPEKATPSFAKTNAFITDWPTVVFCNRGGNEDEPLYMYPLGTQLNRLYGGRDYWHLIDDRKTVSMEVPDFVFDDLGMPLHEAIVGVEIACAYADSDEYGFPSCANEREAHSFLMDELGWGFLAMDDGRPLVEVTSHCRGDDSVTEWWVEARVHPDLYARLAKEFTEARISFETALEATPLNVLLDTPSKEWDAARLALKVRLGAWFMAVGQTPLPEMYSRLLNGYHPSAKLEVAVPPGCVLRADLPAETTAGVLAQAVGEALEAARARASGR